MRKMRKPNVKNKYNFKLNDFKKLKLNVNKDTLAKIFWRNDLTTSSYERSLPLLQASGSGFTCNRSNSYKIIVYKYQ